MGEAKRRGTTAGTSAQPAVSIEAMREMVTALEEAEPFFQFMVGRGKSPRDGWVLSIPKSMADAAGILPSYVQPHYLGDSFGVVAFNTSILDVRVSKGGA